MRWISLGFMNVQPSEFAKLATVLYMASYLERRRDEVQSKWSGFIKPLLVLALLAVLLLLEPDFGAVVVLMLASLALLFLGGVKASQFILTAVVVLGASVLILLSQPYRLKRLTGYWEPWTQENVYGSGYQLTQSLIAFGRGEFSGVGLGNSIQKLFYLPEAHTDFVFAIWSEETGLLGAALIISLFVYIFIKAMKLGRKAYESQQYFPAFVAYGMGLLIGFQGFINLGVNMGLLPTKGLTLPFVSYGGSSLIVCFIALGLLLRVHHEMESLHGKK
jgi:cell division protein FtsW